MPIFNGVDNIANIYHGNNQIVKVYQGANLKYELSLFGLYEEIADVIVTSNTTQIDFNNLNITKDDELRLVYTFVGNDSTVSVARIFVNNNTTVNNYYHQRIVANGSNLTATRANNSDMSAFANNRKTNGYTDIKITNNDKFISSTYSTDFIGSNSNTIFQVPRNIIGTFSATTITNLSIISTRANQITSGSRLTLFKVNTGSA